MRDRMTDYVNERDATFMYALSNETLRSYVAYEQYASSLHYDIAGAVLLQNHRSSTGIAESASVMHGRISPRSTSPSSAAIQWG